MGCCTATFKNQRCHSVGLLIVGAAVLGGATWAALVSSSVKDDTVCIIDAYHALLNEEPPNQLVNLSAAHDAMLNSVSADTIEQVQNVLDWWVIMMATPGTLYFGLLLLAVACSLTALFHAKKNAPGACCARTSKFWLSLSYFTVIVAVVFFGFCAAAGIGASVDSVDQAWEDNVEQPCSESQDEITQQLRDAETALHECEAHHPNAAVFCRPYRQDYEYALAQSETFDSFCACAGRWLDDAKPLAAPGILGLVASLLSLIFSVGLCSSMACCKPYKAAAENPEFNKV